MLEQKIEIWDGIQKMRMQTSSKFIPHTDPNNKSGVCMQVYSNESLWIIYFLSYETQFHFEKGLTQ
mgnify:CR=1 FL=1